MNDEYVEMLCLFNWIDVFVLEVLIEVMIVEVMLMDDNQYGMEFLFNQFGFCGFVVGFGIGGGFGFGDGGFLGSFQSGDYVFDFSVLVINQQINVLLMLCLVMKFGVSVNI